MALVQISRRSALAFSRAFSVRTLTMSSGIKNSSEPLEESPTSSVDGVRQGWGKTLCSDVLHAKKDAGSWLWCSQEDTVLDAVKKMARANVGALLVYNPATLGSTDSQHVTGIVSERDYLTKIAVANKSSATTLVKEIMTTKLLTVGPTTTVMEAMELMCENNVRHVPVVDGSSLNGMLSVRDVIVVNRPLDVRLLTGALGDVTVLVKEHREEVDHLNQWISGTY